MIFVEMAFIFKSRIRNYRLLVLFYKIFQIKKLERLIMYFLGFRQCFLCQRPYGAPTNSTYNDQDIPSSNSLAKLENTS